MVTVPPSTVTASDGEPPAAVLAPSARVTATSLAASQVRSSASKWVSSAMLLQPAGVRGGAGGGCLPTEMPPAPRCRRVVPDTAAAGQGEASARAATEK